MLSGRENRAGEEVPAFSDYSESLLRPTAADCREHLSLMSEARRYLRKAADFHPP